MSDMHVELYINNVGLSPQRLGQKGVIKVYNQELRPRWKILKRVFSI
jgi:hypothetical protein